LLSPFSPMPLSYAAIFAYSPLSPLRLRPLTFDAITPFACRYFHAIIVAYVALSCR